MWGERHLKHCGGRGRPPSQVSRSHHGRATVPGRRVPLGPKYINDEGAIPLDGKKQPRDSNATAGPLSRRRYALRLIINGQKGWSLLSVVTFA